MKISLALLFAVLSAFAGGYATRAFTTPVAQAVTVRATTACPTGSHAAVWYSARAWSCLGD